MALAWILAAGQPPAHEDEWVTTAKHAMGDCVPSARKGGAAREAATLALRRRSWVAGRRLVGLSVLPLLRLLI